MAILLPTNECVVRQVTQKTLYGAKTHGQRHAGQPHEKSLAAATAAAVAVEGGVIGSSGRQQRKPSP